MLNLLQLFKITLLLNDVTYKAIIKSQQQMQHNPSNSQKKKRYRSLIKLILHIQTISLSSIYFGYILVYCGSINVNSIISAYNIDTDIRPDVVSGVLNGCTPIGALIGALTSSILIEKLSRRDSIILINFIAIALGFLIFIPTFLTLIIFRLLQGLIVGFYSTLAPLIIKQLSPNEVAGSLGTMAQLNTVFGAFLGEFVALTINLISEDDSGQTALPYVFVFPLFIVTLQTLLLMFVFPYETPKYLILQKRQSEAKDLIKIIYLDEYVQEVFDEKYEDTRSIAKASIQTDNTDSSIIEGQQTFFLPQKNSKRMRSFLAIHLAMLQQFSGINTLCVYGGYIGGKAIPKLQNYMGSILNGQNVIMTLLSSLVLTKLGRKPILSYGALLAAICNAFAAVGFFLDNSMMVLIGMLTFMVIYGLSLGPVIWLYIPQIVQPNIVPYSTAANWISCSIVVLLFPIITDNILHHNPAGLFLLFAGWCLVSFFANTKYLVETKGRTEKQIIGIYDQMA